MIALNRAARFAKWVARPSTPPALSYLQRARVRMTIFYVGVLFVLLAIVGTAVYVVLAQVLFHEIVSVLRAAAASVDRAALPRTDQEQLSFSSPYTAFL